MQTKIYNHFGYVEDWAVIPLEDSTASHWCLLQNEDGTGKVWFSDAPFTVEGIESGEVLYSCDIYTQRFLPKWVYRADDYTMICVDPRTDGNKFLMIFDNEKELKDPPAEIREALNGWGEL